jgi:hypothetical protein
VSLREFFAQLLLQDLDRRRAHARNLAWSF